MLLAAVLAMVVLSGCGGGGGGDAGDLTVSPSSISLSPGEQATFTVTGCDSMQGVYSAMRWSCAGGSFWMQNGLSADFTAGNESGDYTAMVTDGHVTGYATVHIY